MTQNLYLRVRSAVFRTPWAIVPSRLGIILAYLEARAGGIEFNAGDEVALPQAFMAAQGRVGPEQGVAVIPIGGTMVHRASGMDAMSGNVTSTREVVAKTRAAVEDQRVSAIVHHYHSPGGTVDGVPEAYDAILAMRGEKPIVAIADTMIGSAAYYMAAAADEIVVSPSGQVGSIGVFAVHEDFSEQYARLGQQYTLVASSKFKGEGLDFQPMTDEYRDYLENHVLAYDDMFVNAVAQGRGVKESKVRNEFGQGRMVMAEPAVAAGMADRVETFDDLIARLMAGGGRKRRRVRAQGAGNALEMRVEFDDTEVRAMEERLVQLQREATKVEARADAVAKKTDTLSPTLRTLYAYIALDQALSGDDVAAVHKAVADLRGTLPSLSENPGEAFNPILARAAAWIDARTDEAVVAGDKIETKLDEVDDLPEDDPTEQIDPASTEASRKVASMRQRLRLRGQGPGRTGASP